MKIALQSRHTWLAIAWVAFVAGLIAIYVLTPGNTLQLLGEADLRGFRALLLQSGGDGWLRTVLFADSLLVVPGYLGLFVVFALRSFRRGGQSGGINVPFHLLIAVQVFGALCDLVENGVTMRAAEDALAGVLAPGTLDDLDLLTALKWGGLGAAWLLLGCKAFVAPVLLPGDGRRARLAWQLAGTLAIGAGFLLIWLAIDPYGFRWLALLTWVAALLAFTVADVGVRADHGANHGSEGGEPVPAAALL